MRKQQGLTQEDFSNISSRTYLSSLERGIKGPTIEKVEQLASVLDLHPATILAAAYLIKENGVARRDLVLRIEAELKRFENADYS